MSRRDLGSLFDEEGQGATPAPSEAPRARPVDEPLINDEARQMLEERSRAARESATRAAEVATQKGKELGKAALGALGRMKEEHQRRAQAKAAAKAAAHKAVPSLERITPEEAHAAAPSQDEFTREADGVLTIDGMSQFPDELDCSPDVELVIGLTSVGQGAIGMTTVHELVEPPKRSYKRIALVAGCVLALTAVGGAAYWWSARPAVPVNPPKLETTPVAKPAVPPVAPVLAPTPTVEPVVVPESTVELAAQPEPAQQVVAPAAVVEPEPAPVVAPAPKPVPVVPAPKLRPPPIKSQPKKLEVAPLAQPSKQEEQQIDQIRDFGKQLEQLGER